MIVTGDELERVCRSGAAHSVILQYTVFRYAEHNVHNLLQYVHFGLALVVDLKSLFVSYMNSLPAFSDFFFLFFFLLHCRSILGHMPLLTVTVMLIALQVVSLAISSIAIQKVSSQNQNTELATQKLAQKKASITA